MLSSVDSVRDDPLLSVEAFLLGLFASTNVIYVFSIGNTPVFVSYILAIFILIHLVISRGRALAATSWMMSESVVAFTVVALLSILLTQLYAIGGILDDNALVTVLKGFVSLLAGLAIYVATGFVSGDLAPITKGLAFGLAGNIVACALQVFSFSRGGYFSLIGMFPQTAFYISVPWGAAYPADALPIYASRAQGLFLEASHMMAFLVCLVPFIARSCASHYGRVVIILGTVFCVANASSANTAIFAIEIIVLIVCFVLTSKRHGDLSRLRMDKSAIIMTIGIFEIVVIALLMNGGILNDLMDSVAQAFADVNVTTSIDTGTIDRWRAMTSSISAMQAFPLGAGWNTESVILAGITKGSYISSHSYLIRLMIELGPAGVIAFLFLIGQHVRKAARIGGGDGVILVTAVIFAAIVMFANGISPQPWFWLLLGLVNGRSHIAARSESNERAPHPTPVTSPASIR